ncbi:MULTISPECIES: hypothetical protein [unclassified Crossiella]|uniref:hypothetical protein n=1 Tax=unclassified Crossiella TaxID=2620835 RepID=UPI001FFEE37A|nr:MULTISPECIES: hypothetical protein [unclassified Crossiella]MCK2240967.1 hypothetical protein [Crossiella sp. S99.2]MCK2253889.1 hypothetical protein [Crossiella sp. S99.1]
MPTTSPTRQLARSPRRALLIDLDTLSRDRGHHLDTAQLRQRLETVLACAGEIDHILAAAAPHTVARYLAELVSLRLPVATAVARHRTAPRVLFERAEHLISVGYTEIVLAAGHRSLGVLCRHPKVATIVCAPAKSLSHHLRSCATQVITLC